ncbi:MAG: 5-formyltetrahydrofolate cyclo-ligase [Nitrospirae bacterium]|nr:5-formyltetrahydrofolate cyclo-ligase [Nitrospirota bacterium]
MMTANKLLDKKELRKETIEKRDRIPPEVRAIKDREIMDRLITYKPFAEAGTIMLFASFRTEVNTFPIIEKALQRGKKVALPRVNKSEGILELYYIESMEQLETGYMGIKEPITAPERIALVEDMEVIVLPGVAFDEKGGRIGYGGGYYDRLLDSLKKVPLLVAIAYEEQIVDEIPLEQHDKRVQVIITDKRIIEV